MRGAWGLGCLWCAASKDSPTVQRMRRAHSQQNKAAGRCKQAISRASIWSSYGINTICTPRDLHKQIEQHEATDLHHISQHCFSSSQCHLDYATMKDPRGQAMHRTAHSRDSELCAQPVARCGQPCDAPGAACGAQCEVQHIPEFLQCHQRCRHSRLLWDGAAALGIACAPLGLLPIPA